MTATVTPLDVPEARLDRELRRLAAAHMGLTNRTRDEYGIPEAEYLASYFTATGGLEHAVRRMRALVRREAHRARGRWS
jgi:hypothetical protein